MFQYSPILGHSGVWDIKHTFSVKSKNIHKKALYVLGTLKKAIINCSTSFVFHVLLRLIVSYHCHIRLISMKNDAMSPGKKEIPFGECYKVCLAYLDRSCLTKINWINFMHTGIWLYFQVSISIKGTKNWSTNVSQQWKILRFPMKFVPCTIA